MGKYKKFNEFVASEYGDPKHFSGKISLIKNEWNNDAIVESALSRLFKSIPTYGLNEEAIKGNRPMIYWGGINESVYRLLEDKKNVYNLPKLIKKVYNKKSFYRAFEGECFIPRTVYERYHARKLKYPIIAKKRYTSLGENITFKRYKDLTDHTDQFSLFQEHVTPKRRYTAYFLDNDLFSLIETVDKTRVEQDLSKVPFVEKLENISEIITRKFPVRVYSANVILDENSKIFITSVKSESSMDPNQLTKLYCAVYEKHYEKKLPSWYKNMITESYCRDFNENHYYKNKTVIEKSPYRINYGS